MAKLYQVSVACLPTALIEELDCADREDQPWRVCIYKVSAQSEGEAERIGLDRFHSEVPIACLEDFGIYAVPVESKLQHRKGNSL